jgi:CheY-like chemotaxis protein
MSKKLLLFDTMKLAQMRISSALQSTDYTIQQVSSLEEAMRSALSQQKPEAMLINTQLNNLEGIELARAFKGSAAFPVVIYSVEPPESLQRTCKEIGADGSFSLLASDKEIIQEVLRVVSPGAQRVAQSDTIQSRFLEAVSDVVPDQSVSSRPANPLPKSSNSSPLNASGPITKPVTPLRTPQPTPTATPAINRAGQVLKLASAQALKRNLVLLIDDEASQLLFQRLLLSGQDLTFAEGRSGAEALRLAKEQIPDLLILDFMMPGIDGLEVITRLRQDPLTASIPVLLTVTPVEVSYVSQRKSALQFDILVKPIDQEELQKKVGALLVV